MIPAIPSLTTLASNAKSSVSRGFLYAGLYPVAVFAAASGGMAWWIWPGHRDSLAALYSTTAFGNLAANWVAVVVLFIVAAAVLRGFAPALRRTLEGRAIETMGAGMVRRLQARQRTRRNRLAAAKAEAENHLFHWRLYVEVGDPDNGKTWAELLKDAREAEPPRHRRPNPKDDAESLLREVEKLAAEHDSGLTISYREFGDLVARCAELLRIHHSRAIPRTLTRVQDELNRLSRRASKAKERSVQALTQQLRFAYPQDPARLGVTRMANTVEIHRESVAARYGVEPELLWPRLVKFVQADTSFHKLLQDAESQLDFAVAMTFVSAFFTLSWGPISFSAANSALPFLVTVPAGLVATTVFYHLALEGQLALGQAISSGIDLFRFQLLKALHVRLPDTVEEEQNLWQKLLPLGAEIDGDMVFEHQRRLP